MAHGQFHHADAVLPLTDKSTISDVAPKQQVFDQAIAGEKSANDWAQLKNQGSKSADNSLPALELHSGGKTVFSVLEDMMRRESLRAEEKRNGQVPAHSGELDLLPFAKKIEKPHHEKAEGASPGDKSHAKHRDGDKKPDSETNYDNAIPMPQPKGENYDRAIPMPKSHGYDRAIPMPQPKVENYDNAIPMPQPKGENYDNAIPMPQPKVHNKSIEHK